MPPTPRWSCGLSGALLEPVVRTIHPRDLFDCCLRGDYVQQDALHLRVGGEGGASAAGASSRRGPHPPGSPEQPASSASASRWAIRTAES